MWYSRCKKLIPSLVSMVQNHVLSFLVFLHPSVTWPLKRSNNPKSSHKEHLLSVYLTSISVTCACPRESTTAATMLPLLGSVPRGVGTCSGPTPKHLLGGEVQKILPWSSTYRNQRKLLFSEGPTDQFIIMWLQYEQPIFSQCNLIAFKTASVHLNVL